jgi:hypothetical protein
MAHWRHGCCCCCYYYYYYYYYYCSPRPGPGFRR